MAKPISGIPPFHGKAAEWLTDYLAEAKPDPEKTKRAEEDKKTVASFVPLSELRQKRKKSS